MAGIFQGPSRMPGALSFGQYSRSIGMNLRSQARRGISSTVYLLDNRNQVHGNHVPTRFPGYVNSVDELLIGAEGEFGGFFISGGIKIETRSIVLPHD